MALSVYFDASVIVALLVRDDDFNSRAETFVRSRKPLPVISDFAAVEFASAISKRVRMRDLTPGEARTAFQTLDTWISGPVTSATVSSGDLAMAAASLRCVDLSLRAADAINIAIAKRLGIELATFDTKMAAAARRLGVKVAPA